MIELDIWRTAKLVIAQYGEDGRAHAARRAHELCTAGDYQGQAVWQAISEAVGWLQSGGDSSVSTAQ